MTVASDGKLPQIDSEADTLRASSLPPEARAALTEAAAVRATAAADPNESTTRKVVPMTIPAPGAKAGATAASAAASAAAAAGEPPIPDARGPFFRSVAKGAALALICSALILARGELSAFFRLVAGYEATIDGPTFVQNLTSPTHIIAVALVSLACLGFGVLDGLRDRSLEHLAHRERDVRVRVQALARELEEKNQQIIDGQIRLLQSEKLFSLGGLVAGLTHELNNPLAVITGFSELLLARQDLEPDVKEALEAIHGEAKRCDRIVQNLLAFARQRRMAKSPVDLNEIVSNVVELLGYRFTVDGIRLDLRLDRKTPAALGDLSQIQQVVLHLVTHAHQAALDSPGERAIGIATRAGDDGETVALEVRDSGRPIAVADLPRVFDPFFASRGQSEGGLGLSLCYGIAREHGGRIDVESRPVAGTSFTVHLPKAPPTGPASSALTDSGARRMKQAEGRGVLIVDDEPHIVRLLTRVLTREGYRCAAAGDGEEALRLLRSGAFEVVLADVKMPKLGGIEFYKRVSQETPHLAKRILFTTGDHRGEGTAEFLASIPNKYVKKPFDLDDVMRLVADTLSTPA